MCIGKMAKYDPLHPKRLNQLSQTFTQVIYVWVRYQLAKFHPDWSNGIVSVHA